MVCIQKGVSFTSKELVPGDVPVTAGGECLPTTTTLSNRPAVNVKCPADFMALEGQRSRSRVAIQNRL